MRLNGFEVLFCCISPPIFLLSFRFKCFAHICLREGEWESVFILNLLHSLFRMSDHWLIITHTLVFFLKANNFWVFYCVAGTELLWLGVEFWAWEPFPFTLLFATIASIACSVVEKNPMLFWFLNCWVYIYVNLNFVFIFPL